MKLLKCAIAVAVLVQLFTPIFGSKILGFLLTPARSHFIVHDALMLGLAAKGHDVTVLGVFPGPKQNITNYRYIQLEIDDETNEVLNFLKQDLVKDAASNSGSTILHAPKVLRQFTKMMSGFLRNPVVESLKRDERFDLVVFGYFMNDFQLGIAAHFQCPSVVISSIPAIKPLRDLVGNPAGVAYSEFPTMVLKEPMTFMQRVLNFIFIAIEMVVFEALNYFVYEPCYTEHFPPDKYPSLSETKKNVSLVLVSAHFTQGSPTAAFPALVDISGIQIKRQPNPLPHAVREFLDGAADGAIFFTFGSNINAADMPKEKRDILLKVFGRLKQRVLWKWEDDNLPGRPENVMISKWFPQDDILAHPNVRLFISHCGKGSVNEARYHGVPILGVPMFADQPSNLQGIVDEGWAMPLNFADLNELTFTEKINEMLNNDTYRNVVRTAAALYTDRPEHPLDTAVFWVEYVLRHNGAKHMQSQAVHLNWFQYHSLDVIGFVLIVLWISFRLFKWMVKWVFRRCFGKAKSKKE